MRPAAEAIALVPERTADPLEHVDYRLAETPEDKDRIYRLRYRAYLREGAILPSKSERVTDRYDEEPNNFTFGVYYRDELYSSIIDAERKVIRLFVIAIRNALGF